MKKTVILLGKGELAMQIAQWFQESSDWELQVVVPVIPEPMWTASLVGWCKKSGVTFLEKGHYKDISGVQSEDWKVDLAFSVFYDKIVESWFISKCHRILNLHNGPLPKYKGVSPINWALKNNETEHGLTIHEITSGIDEGPIVAQVKYSIYPVFDEVEDVYKRSLKYGFMLFEQTMPFLDKIQPREQNDFFASYYGKEQNEKLGERRDFTREKSKDR